MTDDIKTEVTGIPPLPVTLIDTAHLGSPLTNPTVAVTPDHQPDIAVTLVQPLVAIGIRFVNTFLTSLLGILTGALATDVITASDFTHLLYKCAGLSVAGAIIGLIKDLITVFGKLEGKYPLATGSI